LLLWGCAADSAPVGRTAPEAHSDPIAELRRSAATANYERLSAADLVERADVIAYGTIVHLEAGRGVKANAADEPAPTVVAEVDVQQTIKGDAIAPLYMELLVGSVDDALFEPGGIAIDEPDQVVVFATRASSSWQEGTIFVNDGQGVPEGAELYRPVNPQGVVENVDGELQQADGLIFRSENMTDLTIEIEGML